MMEILRDEHEQCFCALPCAAIRHDIVSGFRITHLKEEEEEEVLSRCPPL